MTNGALIDAVPVLGEHKTMKTRASAVKTGLVFVLGVVNASSITFDYV